MLQYSLLNHDWQICLCHLFYSSAPALKRLFDAEVSCYILTAKNTLARAFKDHVVFFTLLRKYQERLKMAVTKVSEKYCHNICGNEVTVAKVGDGILVYCAQDMELISS